MTRAPSMPPVTRLGAPSDDGLPMRFAEHLVAWQKAHGRSTLPWQNTRDPYRVWLSEIMLQQTQVSTVLGYYDRFLERFPNVQALAAAPLDEVLGLWSGLGYYSRARNLHRCAQQIVSEHEGSFPSTAMLLQNLPGIGRSTAAAVASFCFNERVAILDGNVKRVLTRLLAYSADLSQSAAERVLWDKANELLPPAKDMPAYTQGVMDLGASLCATRQPQCLICPVQALCAAHREGRPESYPVKTRKLKRSAQALWLLVARRVDGAVWLERRPPKGVWGGLYCPPVFDDEVALGEALPKPLRSKLQPGVPFVHVLTHKDLHLKPFNALLSARQSVGPALQDPLRGGAWFTSSAWVPLGLPAPVRKLLEAGV
jgi:A/G-specific adenine glycosylase